MTWTFGNRSGKVDFLPGGLHAAWNRRRTCERRRALPEADPSLDRKCPRQTRAVKKLEQKAVPLEQGWGAGLCCLYATITILEGRLRTNWRSSTVCAHKPRSDRTRCWSQSRGPTTEIHVAVDARPALRITLGQQVGHASEFLEDLEAEPRSSPTRLTAPTPRHIAEAGAVAPATRSRKVYVFVRSTWQP